MTEIAKEHLVSVTRSQFQLIQDSKNIGTAVYTHSFYVARDPYLGWYSCDGAVVDPPLLDPC
jgi:hypothetical protein